MMAKVIIMPTKCTQTKPFKLFLMGARILIYSLFFLLSLQSIAAESGFSGRWSGPGSAAITNGKTRKCEEIFIEWQEAADKLVLQEGGYLCEDMKAAFDRAIFERKNNELFWKKKKVGEITADSLVLALSVPEENLRYTLTLTKKKRTLQYEEHWSEDGVQIFTVTGELNKI